MSTIINNNSSSGNIDNLTIYRQNLVDSGFRVFYDTLLNIAVYNVYLDKTKLNFQQNNKVLSFDFSLAKLPDVSTNDLKNGDVLAYNGTNFVNENVFNTLNYSSNVQSSRFSDITSVSSISDALNKILYPFLKPTFPSFSIQGKPLIFEIGEYLSTNSGGIETFSWSVSTITNISNTVGYKLLDITNSFTIATGILPKSLVSSNQLIPYGIRYTIANSTNTFRIIGKDTQNNNFQTDLILTWKPRIFWGTSPNTTLTNAQILNLPTSPTGGSALVSNIQNSFTINGNGQYIWIVMPASFGQAIEPDGSNTKFIVGGLQNTFWIISTVNFTNQYGFTSFYNLYRSTSISYGIGVQINII